MATQETEIPVVCYQLPVFNPESPQDFKGQRMRPSPMEKFTGKFGRRETKKQVRAFLEELGHVIHALNFGKHPDTGEDCILVSLLYPEGRPPEKIPEPPPPKPRRTAVGRRNRPKWGGKRK